MPCLNSAKTLGNIEEKGKKILKYTWDQSTKMEYKKLGVIQNFKNKTQNCVQGLKEKFKIFDIFQEKAKTKAAAIWMYEDVHCFRIFKENNINRKSCSSVNVTNRDVHERACAQDTWKQNKT